MKRFLRKWLVQFKMWQEDRERKRWAKEMVDKYFHPPEEQE